MAKVSFVRPRPQGDPKLQTRGGFGGSGYFQGEILRDQFGNYTMRRGSDRQQAGPGGGATSGGGGGGGGIPGIPKSTPPVTTPPSTPVSPWAHPYGAGLPGAGPVAGAGAGPFASWTAKDWLKNFGYATAGLGLISGAGGDGAGGRLPDMYRRNAPGQAGIPHLTRTLSDPYSVNEARLQQELENENILWNRAENATRTGIFQTGQEDTGVGRATGGNVEVSRARSMSERMREFEKFREMLGDERLRSLLMPWLSAYNQAYAISRGQQPSGSNTGDLLLALGMLGGQFA